jgi:cystathionine beta-lyase
VTNLLDLAAFAEENDLIVCSDEIHCGLILDRRQAPHPVRQPVSRRRQTQYHADGAVENLQHPRPRLRLRGDSRRRFASPLPAGDARHRAARECPRSGRLRSCLPRLHRLARELIAYLAGNRDRLTAATQGDFLRGAVNAGKRVKMSHVEATYLAWIDVRQLGLVHPAAHFEAHGLGLSDGADFGAPGWLRLNFGCPRSTLEEALKRFSKACQIQ